MEEETSKKLLYKQQFNEKYSCSTKTTKQLKDTKKKDVYVFVNSYKLNNTKN